MATPTNHRIPTDAGGWMREQEKGLMHEQRRPRITKASDLLGPGIAPHAVEIDDWNGQETEFNGFFFSRPGAQNSPDDDEWWIGQVIAQSEGFGIQTVWDYRGTSSPVVSKSRRFTSVSGERTFSAWA